MSLGGEDPSRRQAAPHADHFVQEMTLPYIVGAYAADLPGPQSDAGTLIDRLRAVPLVGGLEIPFSGAPIPALPLEAHWQLVLTAIPGTVMRAAEDPAFG